MAFTPGKTEAELMEQRARTIDEIHNRGGKEKAPEYAARLETIDAELKKVRAAPKPATAPTPTSPSTGATSPAGSAAGASPVISPGVGGYQHGPGDDDLVNTVNNNRAQGNPNAFAGMTPEQVRRFQEVAYNELIPSATSQENKDWLSTVTAQSVYQVGSNGNVPQPNGNWQDKGAPNAGPPATPGTTPPVSNPPNDALKRQADKDRYHKIATELLPNAKTAADKQKLLDELQTLGSANGWQWQDDWKKYSDKPVPAAPAPAAPGTPAAPTTPGAPATPGATSPGGTDASAGGATSGINTTNGQLQEGLKLARELYPDGSLGRLPNPAPIGAISAFQKVELIDQNGIPKVSVYDPATTPKVGDINYNDIGTVRGVDQSQVPKVKEMSEAVDSGQVKSIAQWEDYYNKSQQRDAEIDAALKRASGMATEGYSSQDMNAKRAVSNREIDTQTQTQLRDLRNSQGSAGNFGGVAAARARDLGKTALQEKANIESNLLAGEGDFKLNANAQAGQLATNAVQTYNANQQAGLTGLTGARATAADEALKRQMSNQAAQGQNQTAYLSGEKINQDADSENAKNRLGVATANQGAAVQNQSAAIQGQQLKQSGEQTNANNAVSVGVANQGAQSTNATNALNFDKTNKDIETGNLDRTQNTTTFNMGQSEKEKAGQVGTMFGWNQYTDAKAIQERMTALQEQLNKILAQGPK